MTLKEFLKLLDSILPIRIYVYDDDEGVFRYDEVPSRYMNRKVEDIFIDENYEDIGIGLGDVIHG